VEEDDVGIDGAEPDGGVGVELVDFPAAVSLVFLFGEKIADVFEITGNEKAIIISTLLAAFIVNAAASCGPSPLGGIGGIGEGNMGIEIGSSGKSQCAGIIVATGVCALVIAVIVKPGV
jgi:hypothetical protein